jgi:hypothetical protein
MFDCELYFLLAHELGHVSLGLNPRPPPPIIIPNTVRGIDRDRLYACDSLIGEGVAASRQQEAAADQYALRLLGGIPSASPPPRLRYEIGTKMLMNAELGKLVTSLMALNPHGPMLAARAGLDVDSKAVEALAQRLGDQRKLMQTVFPSTHPALVDRLLTVVESLNANPMSLQYGRASFGQDARAWQMLIALTCSRLGETH